MKVPLVVRGKVIEEDGVEFGARSDGVRFTAPDVRAHLRRLPLALPSQLADLHALSFDDILDFLDRLAERLTLRNPHLQAAFELSTSTSGLGAEILRATYDSLGAFFERSYVRDHADITIGIPFLEDWVKIRDDRGYAAKVRAFGARAVHIVAGNSPGVCAISLMRNFITRSDVIVKTPSNDPLTAGAIARTMIDIDPDHPLTRHVSVAYWKGGDAEIEDQLYHPRSIEKIVAWGGLASVRHVTKYIQPGIDLITMDPKLSSTIIGAAAFESEATMREAAGRLALAIGVMNQEACLNARVVYIECGTGLDGIEIAARFGQLVFDAMQALPPSLSGPAIRINPALQEELEGLPYYAGVTYTVIGCDRRGGIIVSNDCEPIHFAPLLANRIANLVPVENLETAVRTVNAYTQTIGIYPNSLLPELRDRLAFHGAQRLVSLGYATRRVVAGAAGGNAPARRMCRWVLEEDYDAALDPPMTARPGMG